MKEKRSLSDPDLRQSQQFRAVSYFYDRLPAMITFVVLIAVWQAACTLKLVPPYMLPSPISVIRAIISNRDQLFMHASCTLQEAFWGLVAGVILGCLFAILMDAFEWLYKALYPLLVITQTIPTIAIAPLLVLWFGYEMLPKIILIVLVGFFPMTVGLLAGFRSVDEDEIRLFRSMGANAFQIFVYLKWPTALPEFFSALRIACAYSIVGAVIAEWLGGFRGLGVYMIRVKQAFQFDNMFAVILVISLLSLGLMKLVDLLQRRIMPYKYLDQ